MFLHIPMRSNEDFTGIVYLNKNLVILSKGLFQQSIRLQARWGKGYQRALKDYWFEEIECMCIENTKGECISSSYLPHKSIRARSYCHHLSIVKTRLAVKLPEIVIPIKNVCMLY